MHMLLLLQDMLQFSFKLQHEFLFYMFSFIVFKIVLLTLNLHWCKLINIWQCCMNFFFFLLYPILYSIYFLNY